MRPARLLLLLVALVAGGLAAFLATRGTTPVTVVEQVAVPAAKTNTEVLVAKQPIGVGQRLAPADVEWQPWPDNAVRPEFITIAKSPDAPAKISGAVARFEIFPGEPILDAKLAHTNQGYMSAVLDPGMRGVSIDISPASGSGGFIIPNDHVDVVVTDSTDGQTHSRVLLSDVKVLAIGTRLGQTGTTGAPADPSDPKSQVFTAGSIATLELTPPQADMLINATASGKISLVLRSVADFASAGPATGAAAQSGDDRSVKLIRFGRSASVTPGGPQQGSVSPAAYVPPPVVAAPAAPVVTTTTTPATTTVTTTAPAGATPATPAVPPVPVQ